MQHGTPVKPSAQPTLVRTQHLPLGETPAQGCRGMPGCVLAHAVRCHWMRPFATGRGIYAGWLAAGLAHSYPRRMAAAGHSRLAASALAASASDSRPIAARAFAMRFNDDANLAI